MKLRLFLLASICMLQLAAFSKDVLTFGNKASERQHELHDSLTEVYTGGKNCTARRMMPGKSPDCSGGTIRFRMKVDGRRQNYFTVRCWGSGSDNTMILLFVEGKQAGYRHLGDYGLLHRGNGQKPCQGRFYYYTVPIPIKFTEGKSSVLLELRSYGNIWDYGNTFDIYQKKMDQSDYGKTATVRTARNMAYR